MIIKLIKALLFMVYMLTGSLGFALVLLGGFGAIPEWMLYGIIIMFMSIYCAVRILESEKRL